VPVPVPAYSPELNPDEWVWKDVKADRIGRPGIDLAKGNLRSKAVAAMRRLQKLPCLIRGFFADPNLLYTTP
jgi:transposase